MTGGLADMTHLPGGTSALAAWIVVRNGLGRLWAGSPFYQWMLSGPSPEGLLVAARDPRSADLVVGREILAGRFALAGSILDTEGRGDPWDQPNPSERFALALHRMDWLADLIAVGPEAHEEALRLILDWSRVFGRWNRFSWSPPVLQQRVLNLAYAVGIISPAAAAADRDLMGRDLARQARHLLWTPCEPSRAAERAAIVAICGTALFGAAGEKLVDRGLLWLDRALPETVHADGGHTSRSPQAALELASLLRILAQALGKRGMVGSDIMVGAMDRLEGIARFFALADGSIPQFQGGESCEGRAVERTFTYDAVRVWPEPRNGYHRLDGAKLQIVVDAAAPPTGSWSQAACAQPLAFEALARGRRLIVNSGWSPQAVGPQAMRMSDSASTLSLGDGGCGAPLRGWQSRVLGPRLVGPAGAVEVRSHEAEGAVWLEMSHETWAKRHRMRHERRLFLDLLGDELRGEDRVTPMGDSAAAANRRFIPYAIRFHVHPQVAVNLARDGKSALLRVSGDETAWRLRSDAQETAVEASGYFKGGVARRTQQIVLRGHVRADAGTKVRWKLAQEDT